MPNFTWNRYPIKNLLLDSLRTLIVESTYLKRIKMILSVADFWCALSYQNLCTVVSKSLHTLCIFLLYFFFRSRIKISAHTLYFSSKGDCCHDCSAYLTCGNKSTVWSRQCHFLQKQDSQLGPMRRFPDETNPVGPHNSWAIVCFKNSNFQFRAQI